MRRTCATWRPAVPVTGLAAAGVPCLVPRFCVCRGQGLGQGVGEKMEETRHPTHRRYRWWTGMLKGAVAGASPAGPWTDRRTGVRTPDHDERQPWRIPLDRPCLLPVLAQKWYRENGGRLRGLDPEYSVSRGTGDECQRMIPDRPGVQGLSKLGWGPVRHCTTERVGEGGGRERETQHGVQGAVAILRRRVMSLHQVGVYPSG